MKSRKAPSSAHRRIRLFHSWCLTSLPMSYFDARLLLWKARHSACHTTPMMCLGLFSVASSGQGCLEHCGDGDAVGAGAVAQSHSAEVGRLADGRAQVTGGDGGRTEVHAAEDTRPAALVAVSAAKTGTSQGRVLACRGVHSMQIHQAHPVHCREDKLRSKPHRGAAMRSHNATLIPTSTFQRRGLSVSNASWSFARAYCQAFSTENGTLVTSPLHLRSLTGRRSVERSLVIRQGRPGEGGVHSRQLLRLNHRGTCTHKTSMS